MQVVGTERGRTVRGWEEKGVAGRGGRGDWETMGGAGLGWDWEEKGVAGHKGLGREGWGGLRRNGKRREGRAGGGWEEKGEADCGGWEEKGRADCERMGGERWGGPREDGKRREEQDVEGL